jgi:hypothetical protein
MYADERFPSVVPPDNISSYEALVGATAARVPIDVKTLYYLVFSSVFAAIGVLVVWRFAREAGARYPLVVVAVAMAFAMFSSSRHGWSLPMYRPYWGKAILVWVAVPFLWRTASSFARSGARRDLLWLFAGSIAAFGFSSSGTFVAPLVTAAVVGGMIVVPGDGGVRRAVQAAPAVVPPLLIGVVGAMVLAGSGITGDIRSEAAYVEQTLPRVIGAGREVWFVVLLTLAGWLAVPARRLRISMAFGVLGVLALVSPVGVRLLDAVSSGGLAYRMLWALPMPVIVGLVAESAMRRVPFIGSIATAAFVIVMIVVLSANGLVGRLATFGRPGWDMDEGTRVSAERLIEAAAGAGTVAAPPRISILVSQLDHETKAANPRQNYTRWLRPVAGRSFHADERMLLTDFLGGKRVAAPDVRDALELLDVAAICLPRRTADRLEHVISPLYEHSYDDRLCSAWVRDA